MTSRYDSRKIGVNNTNQHKALIETRSVNYIRQYFSPELKHPTDEEISQLTLISHVWGMGDHFFKLSNQYYGDPKLWWVIAWFNLTPTESHVKPGDVLQIPLPLDRILEYLDI